MARSFIVFVVALRSFTVAAQEDAELDGTVVTVGEVPVQPTLEGAAEAGGANWRGENVTPRAAVPSAAPDAEIDELRASWTDADFSSCLAKARAEALDPARLFKRGHRDAAAAVLVLSAGCALGAGDRELAASFLTRAIHAELDIAPLVGAMTMDIQRVAEELIAAAQRTPRVTLSIQTVPADAVVSIDGRSCPASPCVMELLPGEHVVVGRRIGHLPRVQPMVVTENETRVLTLDPAAPDMQRQQLEQGLAADLSPADVNVLRTASSAFGTPLLVTAWQRGDGYRLALFDRRLGEQGSLVAQARSDGSPDALQRSAHRLVDEWRDLQPRSILRSPWFWIGAALIVGGAVSAAVLLSREPERTYTLVGQ